MVKKIYFKGKNGEGKHALVDSEDFQYLNQFNWFLHHSGAVVRNKRVSLNKYKSLQMHREIMGASDGKEIDHINYNRRDNRKNNLRICNRSQNARNQKLRVDNSSGYKGVYWNKEKGLWQAQMRNENKKMSYLGRFKTKEEAALAYNISVIKVAGEFAVLNNLRGGY